MVVKISMGVSGLIVDGGSKVAMGKKDVDVQERDRGG